MASSLAAQLSVIATSSESSLNLKAQKAKHSKSLIFEPRTAASQSFETIYTLCHEGFQELCLLDRRFLEFQKDIFSGQSQEEDRTQMTAQQNSHLDKRLEAFLGLVGGRLRLSPAIKAVEWLVRRFRVHEHNSTYFLLTFLPYHTLPIFATALSILPETISHEYKFLHPYTRSLTSPPRHAIVQAAIKNAPFASSLNSYVLRICQLRQNYPTLLVFWAGIMSEAVGGMLEKARSGRKAVQQQNQQDVVLKLLPTLNEALAMKQVPDLRVGCYMILSVMASKGGLDDKLLTAMMEAVVLGWTAQTILPGLVCLSVLAQYRGAKQLTRRLTKELLKVQDLPKILVELSNQRRIDRLANGLCLALVERLRKHGDITGLPIVQEVIKKHLLSDSQSVVLVKALILVAYQIDETSEIHRTARTHLAGSLVALMQISGHAGSVIQEAIKNTEVDMDDLELKLQISMQPPRQDLLNDEVMEDSVESIVMAKVELSDMLEQLPKETEGETSFLAHKTPDIYTDLCHAFLASTSSPSGLDMFDEAPIIRRASALQDTTYITFYIKTWCGRHPVIGRVSALQMATRRLRNSEASGIDLQAMVPYVISALGDVSPKVRRAAAELVMVLQNLYPAKDESKKKAKQLPRWANDDLYGPSDNPPSNWTSTEVMARLLGDVLAPALEECLLDRKHIESVFQKSLNSSRTPESSKKQDAGRLSQSLRASILSFLASHVVHTPLLSVKLQLLTCLNQVRSVAGMTRTKVLLPALKQWISLSSAELLQRCQGENVDAALLDDQLLMVVTANDKEGIQFLMSIIEGKLENQRPQLVRAIFKRLSTIWSSLTEELQLSLGQTLLDLAQHEDHGQATIEDIVSEASAALLRSSALSTEILLCFLEQLPTVAKLTDKPPATKRRRTSHGEVARAPVQDSKQVSAAIRRVTFVLQLVDGAEPGNRPELLKGLFNVLAELQHFKAQVASELAYLQGLALGNLLAIVKTYKENPKIKLDRSAVRADLLVDCVQKTASPQVQNAALLLIAALAESAPELVLHSVMPIFTFMGSSVLRQNDDYSAYVINQTIREVIPPLITSLRKEKSNPVTGAAELLLSFVAAYEHVPPHRRKGLFTSLVETLGPEDFLFAFLAMLVDKYGCSESIQTFATELSSAFSVEVQLATAVQYINLVVDILKPKPVYSTVLLSANDDGQRDKYQVALTELSLLPHHLAQKRLSALTGKLLDRDDMNAARVRELYSTLLENVLALADTVREQKSLHGACGEVLEGVLGLLSTREFVKSVEGLLFRPNEQLRRKILRSLEVRINLESSTDPVSRIAMLGFLPQLTEIIRQSTDVLYKHTAVACIDKISEKYGKKDLEAVAAAAETIAGSHCLGQTDERLRIMALLCLASLVDILREGIVSVLPAAMPKAVEYMEGSMRSGSTSEKLHNAGYAFISALAQHVPYMLAGSKLDKLLEISNLSAEARLDESADESRIQCLQLAAKQIDAKSMFGALEKNWPQASVVGPLALREYLDILSIAINKHPKSVVTKYSPVLAKIFQGALDLRRQWTTASDQRFTRELMADIENEVNEVAIKMIYKFNDATFRPIFTNLVQWSATSLPKKDRTGRALRLQSLYGFMAVFFDNLKSIVTSYATYLVDNSVDVLKSVDPKDDLSKELWSRVLQTLVSCFEHDEDDFWQSPSHFNAVAPVLCAQFTHASFLPLERELIPAIVELAAAADSSSHHKELNNAILKNLRSETASVRLAAVKCEQELTDRLGEEWLSMLPEMLPFISELQEDDDDVVEKETHRWIVKIETVLGESLDSMLQ